MIYINRYVGKLIGKQGQTIKRISTLSGAEIDFGEDNPGFPYVLELRMIDFPLNKEGFSTEILR